MKDICFEIDDQKYDSQTQKPKGDNIFFRCLKCRTILPSNPEFPVRCECRNITLDPEMFKIGVNEYKNFSVIRLKT